MRQKYKQRLWAYAWLDSLAWPRSYVVKQFIIAFLATHLPLISFIGYLMLRQQHRIDAVQTFLLMLLATLVGTVLLLWFLYELLKPVLLAGQALEAYFTRGEIISLPTSYQDEVGSLLANLAYTLETVEKQRQKLQQSAAEDFLTGLLNRRAAEQSLQESRQLALHKQLPLCIAFLDVDYFKRINDLYGHASGDQVLVALSHLLRRHFNGKNWGARWGGEEFLLVLYQEVGAARLTLEEILREISQLRVATSQNTIKLTASIGYTIINSPQDTLKKALCRADDALYRAKNSGRNCLHFRQSKY